MNGALLEAFRHNAWASKELLGFCLGLSDTQLDSAAAGTFGGILATFKHLVRSDADYIKSLTGSGPDWMREPDESADLERLRTRVEATEPLWERFLSTPVNAERVIVVDQGVREVRAGVFVAQALYHGNAHREQICSILTGLGIEPPDIQAWGYAEATGRMWERTQNR